MTLFFRETPAAAPDAQPLVILHGLFGSSDNWLMHSKFFSQQGYHVYTVDQRNHGQSFHSEVFDYDALAADLRGFVLDRNLQKPVLLGHSMGGKTVMQYAMNYPATGAPTDAAKLVVVDIAPRAYPVHHADIIRGLTEIDLGPLRTRPEADTALAAYEPNPSVRQFLLKNLYRPDGQTFGWRLNVPVIARELARIGAAIGHTHPVPVPTLFVRGANSTYITDDDYPAIQTLFPQVRIETIAGAGHWVQAEQPTAFSEAVLRFIGNQGTAEKVRV
jgi:esterase